MLVKLQRPPPEMRIFSASLPAWSTSRTRLPRWAAVAASPLATACGLIYRRALSSRHAFDVFSTREAACEFVGFQLGAGELFSRHAEPQRS